MSKNCIITTVKSKIKGNATSYIEKENEIFIPISKKFTLNQTRAMAQDKVNKINKEYLSEKFGEVVSLNSSYTDGTGINIHPSQRLVDAYEVKEGNKTIEQVNSNRNLEYFNEDEALLEQEQNEDNLIQKELDNLIKQTNSLNNDILFQKQTQSSEGQIASEKTIRDLAARMSDRIGIPFRIISDRTQQFKGKIENNTAIVNLAYATLDTPIHEILGHPIIRAIKNAALSERSNQSALLEYKNAFIVEEDGEFFIKKEDGSYWSNFETKEEAEKELKIIQKANSNETSQLYQNLLKELEYGKGKEVLDRIKRDYDFKPVTNINSYNGVSPKGELVNGDIIADEFVVPFFYDIETGKEYENIKFRKNEQNQWFYNSWVLDGEEVEYTEFESRLEEIIIPDDLAIKMFTESGYVDKKYNKYTLEEQQEEAIVELLSLMVADKLNKITDKNLISLLKQLLKQINDFIKSLLNTKELNINDIEADNTKFLIENKLKELIKNGIIKKEC